MRPYGLGKAELGGSAPGTSGGAPSTDAHGIKSRILNRRFGRVCRRLGKSSSSPSELALDRLTADASERYRRDVFWDIRTRPVSMVGAHAIARREAVAFAGVGDHLKEPGRSSESPGITLHAAADDVCAVRRRPR